MVDSETEVVDSVVGGGGRVGLSDGSETEVVDSEPVVVDSVFEVVGSGAEVVGLVGLGDGRHPSVS